MHGYLRSNHFLTFNGRTHSRKLSLHVHFPWLSTCLSQCVISTVKWHVKCTMLYGIDLWEASIRSSKKTLYAWARTKWSGFWAGMTWVAKKARGYIGFKTGYLPTCWVCVCITLQCLIWYSGHDGTMADEHVFNTLLMKLDFSRIPLNATHHFICQWEHAITYVIGLSYRISTWSVYRKQVFAVIAKALTKHSKQETRHPSYASKRVG